MRYDGKLTKWNDDRGFGFITGSQDKSDIFVHVSAFPKDGSRPKLGERISFEIEIAANGKKNATSLVCLDRSTTSSNYRAPQNKPRKYRQKTSFVSGLISVVIFVMLGAYAYKNYDRFSYHSSRNATNSESQIEQLPAKDKNRIADLPTSSASFTCDGRLHCSQMTSCAEATYFLRYCPGVKMDGDGDGIPCEEQLCR
jgi:cold shock CspA family protein